jgi:hypothetical protein
MATTAHGAVGRDVDLTKAEVPAYQRAVVAPAIDLRTFESVPVLTELSPSFA